MPSGKLPDTYISTREAGALLGCNAISIETGNAFGSQPEPTLRKELYIYER